MKAAGYVLVLCVLCVGSGCTLVNNATHNILWEVCLCKEESAEKHRNRQMADAAWQALCADKPASYSEHHARGFKDGFSDYLLMGGSGQPPTLPPPRYWKRKYQSPLGYAAIEDWFTGFRMGTAAAIDTGVRNYVTLPAMGVPRGELPGPVQAKKRTPLTDIAKKAPAPVSSQVALDLIREAQQLKGTLDTGVEESGLGPAGATMMGVTLAAPVDFAPAPGPIQAQISVPLLPDAPPSTADSGDEVVQVPELLIRHTAENQHLQPASVGDILLPEGRENHKGPENPHGIQFGIPRPVEPDVIRPK